MAEQDPIKKRSKSREAFQKWWKANRNTLNSTRASRYKSDPDYRRKIVERQAAYRKTLSRSVHDGIRTRVINGERVRVFTATQVSELIGRSVATIRQWEAKEWIPKHTAGGVHRHYTPGQVQLMQELVALLNSMSPPEAGSSPVIKEKVQEIFSRWKGA